MTITLTEMFLFGWAMVMTVLWIGAKARLRIAVTTVVPLFRALADKEVEMYRDSEGNVKVRETLC
jgi:hypothetical protein